VDRQGWAIWCRLLRAQVTRGVAGQAGQLVRMGSAVGCLSDERAGRAAIVLLVAVARVAALRRATWCAWGRELSPVTAALEPGTGRAGDDG